MGKKNKGKRDPEKIEEARALFEEAIKDTQKMELTLMELLVTRDYKKHILRLSVPGVRCAVTRPYIVHRP